MKAHERSFDVVSAFLNFANLGSAWVMWLMIALAVILVAVIVERAVLYRRTRVNAPRLGRALVDYLEEGKLEGARLLLAQGRGMEERVIADGLSAWRRGPRAVELIMKSSLERERQRFERFLNFIGTLGNNAPFVGLFGTVVGIVVAFQDLSQNPKGGMAVVGPGIAEALVATAVGLLVAIPAVVAFNSFKTIVATRIGNVEFLSAIVLAQLGQRGE
jgi:biopolymer transport protein ExbB